MNEVRKGFDDFLNTFNGNKQLSTFLDFHRGIQKKTQTYTQRLRICENT